MHIPGGYEGASTPPQWEPSNPSVNCPLWWHDNRTPVVTKHRIQHCLVCEEIVVPDRSNLSRLGGSVRFRQGATENKDHSALIAPSRSNRGSRRLSHRTPKSTPPRPFFSPSFPFYFLWVWFRRSTAISHAKIKCHVYQSIRANNALVHDSQINPGALLSIFPAIRTIWKHSRNLGRPIPIEYRPRYFVAHGLSVLSTGLI